MTPLTKGGRWLKNFGQLSSFGSSMTEQSGYRLLKRSTAKGHMPAGGRARPSALKEVLEVSWQNRLCSTVELIILPMSQNVWWGLSPAWACLDQSFYCSFTCGAFSCVWLYLFCSHPGHNTVQNLKALKRTNEFVRKNEIACVWNNNTWSSMLPWKAGTTIILRYGVKWAQMFNCIDFPGGNRITLRNLHCKEVCPRNGKSISENNELPTSARIQKAKVLLTQKC